MNWRPPVPQNTRNEQTKAKRAKSYGTKSQWQPPILAYKPPTYLPIYLSIYVPIYLPYYMVCVEGTPH